jgi:hypothetical protein
MVELLTAIAFAPVPAACSSSGNVEAEMGLATEMRLATTARTKRRFIAIDRAMAHSRFALLLLSAVHHEARPH